MKTRHAVITNEHVITISEEVRKLCRVPLPSPVRHISDLWALGKRMNITHFWIMPDTDIDQLGHAFLSNRDGYKIFIPGEERKDIQPHAASCKKGFEVGAFEIEVNYPASGDGFGWTCACALDILATIDYLSSLLCIDDIKYSAQYIGKLYLKEKYKATKRLQSYLRKPTMDLLSLPFASAAPEIFFCKPLDASMIGQYYLQYDKNSAHPSAASTMVTGCGDPTHLLDDIVPKSDPGIYRVTCTSNPTKFNGVDLPPIVASEWVTLDVLKFAIKQGCTFDIHEAYVFEQHTNIFGDWARDLWQVRQTLKDASIYKHPTGRQNAYDTIKNVMNFTISAQTANKNWWADMVGMARVARLANLAKFAESGRFPFVIYVDDMGFVSPDPNPETAVPGILDRAGKLGGYKHQFKLLITEQMVQDAPKPKGDRLAVSAKQMFSYFKKIAKQEGLIDG